MLPPPEGWRLTGQVNKPDRTGADFLPKQRSIPERMWVTITNRPEIMSQSMDQLLQSFRPIFICQSKDMKVLSEDANEALFEESDAVCYGRTYRYTIARVVRGKSNVSIFVYRADVHVLPGDRRDWVLKTLSAAPLDKAPLPTQAVAQNNSAPSAAASP